MSKFTILKCHHIEVPLLMRPSLVLYFSAVLFTRKNFSVRSPDSEMGAS